MDKIIEDITRKIVAEVNPGRLVLFGSRALGKQKAESDIDLCIIESKTIDKSREFMKVRKILGDFIQPMDILFFNG